jgi:DNA polymerase I
MAKEIQKEKALLLDASYFDEQGESIICLFVSKKNEHYWLKAKDFKPYLYVLAGKKEAEKTEKELLEYEFGGEERFKAFKVIRMKHELNGKIVLKIEFKKVSHVVQARKLLAELGYERYEYDIPFGKRYLLDKGLEPGNWIEYNVLGEEEFAPHGKIEQIGLKNKALNGEDEEENLPETNFIGKAKLASEIKTIDGNFESIGAAFDLETRMGKKFRIGEEPILMASIAANELGAGKGIEQTKVFSYETKQVEGLEILESEKKLIEKLGEELNSTKLNFLITYNGDNFDFAYLRERARKLGIGFTINGFEPRTMRHGLDNAVKLQGIQHIDSYQIMKFLQRTGAVNTVKMDLETVSEKVFGEAKEKVFPKEINEAWESKDAKKLGRLVDYNLKDSKVAFKIAKEFLPLFVEISKLTSQTLYETTRNSTSQMVENLLLKEAHARGIIAPNKPKEPEIRERTDNPIKGAFVKEPLAGLHEHIAVLDFASLYPSIIISHNISPETLNCGHEECKKNVSPDGTYFCKKQKGLVPEILEKMLKQRLALKKEYKHKKKENGIDDKILFAKQWALKIILNSVYGYTGYPRARWYSRECASAITAWAREYIHSTISKAEKEGFKVLYADSITKDRFVTILNPAGHIEVKNIEQLFKEINSPLRNIGEKEAKSASGYFALSVDTLTREAQWSKINEVIRRKTNKKLFRVNQKFGETLCTEDHSIIAEDNFVLKETKPNEMNGKKFFAVSSIPKSKEIAKIDLFKLLKGNYFNRIYKNQNVKSCWDNIGGRMYFGFKGFGGKVGLKQLITVGSKEFEALCRLLGAYVAEGSASTMETSFSRSGASIASSNVKWLKELEEDYHTLFSNVKTSVIQSTKKKRTLTYGKNNKTINYFDNTHKLQMMNQASAQFFKGLCGQKSSGKRLPYFIFNVPDKYKLLLLGKMIEGDGSHAVNKKLRYTKEYIQKNFSYTTKSLGLASGVSLLLRQLGRNYSIQYRPEKSAYTLHTSDKSNSRIITKIAEEKYEGFVYDLSVEKNNNFVDACGQVLLHNTDSNFLKMLGKSKADVEDFAEKINKELPEGMELEIDGFYKRGIFVTKKEGGAAKKRYALMDEKGNLKIVGFEYVRRDWCSIAKETQKKVIELVLSQGNPQEAAKYVRGVLNELKEGKVPKSELVIMTVLQRKPKDYDAIGPHVAAAEKAIKRGKELGVGSMLSFIITKGNQARQSFAGGANSRGLHREKASISDKAELEEFVEEGNYDPDYYIENQVLPAVIKIMRELGYTKEDLIHGGKQTGLGAWG